MVVVCTKFHISLFHFSVRKPMIDYPDLNLVALGTLNLQRFSMIRIAITIWTQKKWNDSVAELFSSCRKKNSIVEWERTWMKVTEQAFADLHKMNLPSTLLDHIEFIVEMVGHELLLFLKYFKDCYAYDGCRKDYIRVEEICWTSFGTIDKIKTHRNFSYRCATAHIRLACPLCIESTIIRVWIRIMRNRRMTSFTQKYFSYLTMAADPYQLFIFCGHLFKYSINKFQFIDDPTNVIARGRGETQKLLLYHAQQGNFEGFVYFWKKLKKEECHGVLPLLMQIFNYPAFTITKYPSFSEMILFIMNKVDGPARRELTRRCGFVLMNGLLEKWPYHGIVVNQFDRIIPHLSNYDYRNIVLEILSKMHRIETTRIKHKYYREEFRFLWGNMEYYVARATNDFVDFLQDRLALAH